MVLDMDINSLYHQNLGGFKKGELFFISTPKGVGKSMFYDFESFIKPKEKEPKYKFSRTKWYTVDIPINSFEKMQERIEWCEQHFGDEPQYPDAWCRWYSTTLEIKFRDSKDYEWYMLRWA